MDARAKTIRDLLHAGDQYLVPFFQRHYAWRARHWGRLWDDVRALLAAGDDEADADDAGGRGGRGGPHFLGPLVCTPLDAAGAGAAGAGGDAPPAYQLIDGQQRLTTLTLLLAALRDVAAEHGLAELAAEVTEDYLTHKRERGLRRYKVVPRVGDREVLIAVVDGDAAAQSPRDGIVRACRFFRQRVRRHVAVAADPGRRLRGLLAAVTGRLSLVVITIAGEDPYEIFESLNSTGLPLEESDLIRNHVFMQVPLAEQDAFNARHWDAFERMFEGTAHDPPLRPTLFYRDYLMRDGAYSKKGEAFADFKAQTRGAAPPALVAELRRYAAYDLMIRRPRGCPDAALAAALGRVALLEVTTANPLILHLLARHGDGRLGKDELLGCLRDLESFVIRRSVCGEGTRSYARWFPAAIRAIAAAPRQDLAARWLALGWPDDAAFAARLADFPLYRREPLKCRVILRALEEALGGGAGRGDVAALAVEHVMPRAIGDDAAGRAWRATLGADWRRAHARLTHTLGNLTLADPDPSLSGRPFEEKRALLADGGLALNRYFAGRATWDAAQIVARGAALAASAAQVWARPPGAYVPGPPDLAEEDDANAAAEPVAAAAAPSTDDAATTRAKAGGRPAKAAPRLKLEYWDALNDHLRARHPSAGVLSVGNRKWVIVRSGRKGTWFGLVIDLPERRARVEFFCRPHLAGVLEALRRAQPALKAAAGVALEWRERLPHGITLSADLREVDFADRADWPRQHAWLADKLAVFRAMIPPLLGVAPRAGGDAADSPDGAGDAGGDARDGSGGADAPDVLGRDDADRGATTAPADRAGRRGDRYLTLRYWQAFAAHLVDRQSFLKPPKAFRRPWACRRLARGVLWCAQVDPDGGWAWAGLCFERPAGSDLYRALRLRDAELARQLGPDLTWEGDDDGDCAGIYRPADPLAEDEWADQHDWLREQLELLYTAFKPRLATLLKSG